MRGHINFNDAVNSILNGDFTIIECTKEDESNYGSSYS